MEDPDTDSFVSVESCVVVKSVDVRGLLGRIKDLKADHEQLKRASAHGQAQLAVFEEQLQALAARLPPPPLPPAAEAADIHAALPGAGPPATREDGSVAAIVVLTARLARLESEHTRLQALQQRAPGPLTGCTDPLASSKASNATHRHSEAGLSQWARLAAPTHQPQPLEQAGSGTDGEAAAPPAPLSLLTPLIMPEGAAAAPLQLSDSLLSLSREEPAGAADGAQAAAGGALWPAQLQEGLASTQANVARMSSEITELKLQLAQLRGQHVQGAQDGGAGDGLIGMRPATAAVGGDAAPVGGQQPCDRRADSQDSSLGCASGTAIQACEQQQNERAAEEVQLGWSRPGRHGSNEGSGCRLGHRVGGSRQESGDGDALEQLAGEVRQLQLRIAVLEEAGPMGDAMQPFVAVLGTAPPKASRPHGHSSAEGENDAYPAGMPVAAGPGAAPAPPPAAAAATAAGPAADGVGLSAVRSELGGMARQLGQRLNAVEAQQQAQPPRSVSAASAAAAAPGGACSEHTATEGVCGSVCIRVGGSAGGASGPAEASPASGAAAVAGSGEEGGRHTGSFNDGKADGSAMAAVAAAEEAVLRQQLQELWRALEQVAGVVAVLAAGDSVAGGGCRPPLPGSGGDAVVVVCGSGLIKGGGCVGGSEEGQGEVLDGTPQAAACKLKSLEGILAPRGLARLRVLVEAGRVGQKMDACDPRMAHMVGGGCWCATA
jgi:hypothetical protein